MKSRIITLADTSRCPHTRLDARHYRPGGMCFCFEADGTPRIDESAPKRPKDAVT